MQVFVNSTPQLLTAQCTFPKMDIWEEKSMYRCSPTFVLMQEEKLARRACSHVLQYYKADIERAEKDGLSAIVDTSVQKLLPGQFAESPGWHCDGVPRHPYDGRLQFSAINNNAFSVMVSLSSEPMGVAHTEFVVDAIKPKVWDKEDFYRDLNDQVERISPKVATISDGQFTKYTPKSIHRAVSTHRRGWRFWFRFSMCFKPPISNTMGLPQQVYVSI